MAHTDKSTPGPATVRGFCAPKPPPEAGEKPSPGRGWQGAALTGVGRYELGPGAAPGALSVHPGLLWPSGCFPSSVTGFARATFPVGEGDLRRGTKPSPAWRGWHGEAVTGVEGTPESSNRARSNILGVPSTSAAAAAPSPSRRRQGLLSFGVLYEMVTARPLTRGAGCGCNYEITLHTP